jgi:opacity protein-like surface antigen
MMRIARVLPMLFALTCCSAALLQAQPATTDPYYAQIDVAATLGHKSDAAIGGELGYRLRPKFDVFFEGGHIGNAASADLDARATTIGNAVGASTSAVAKVNYFDVGVRYLWPEAQGRFHPYVTAGIGAAHVRNRTTLSVNGTAVDPASLGVQFGTDLSGSVTSAYLMLGGGATTPFGKRYFVDLSYRYGRVFHKNDSAGNVVVRQGSA